MPDKMPAPLAPAAVRALRSHLLLELVATRYTGIDLVAARAELDRRLAAVGETVANRYPVIEGAVSMHEQAIQAKTNEKRCAPWSASGPIGCL